MAIRTAEEVQCRAQPVGIMIAISYLMKKQEKSFYDNIKTILKWGHLWFRKDNVG